jgi:hypothetical protein
VKLVVQPPVWKLPGHTTSSCGGSP